MKFKLLAALSLSTLPLVNLNHQPKVSNVKTDEVSDFDYVNQSYFNGEIIRNVTYYDNQYYYSNSLDLTDQKLLTSSKSDFTDFKNLTITSPAGPWWGFPFMMTTGNKGLPNDNRLYIGTFNRGLYYKNPTDNTFIKPANWPGANAFVGSIMQDDNGVMWVGFEGGLHKNTRTNVDRFTYALQDNINPISLASKGQNYYFGDYTKGLWASHDGGVTWAQNNLINAAGFPTEIYIDSNNDLFVGTFDGVFISKDNGTSFTKLPGVDDTPNSFVILQEYNHKMFVGTDENLFVSDVNNLNFSRIKIPGTKDDQGVLALNVANDNLFITTETNLFMYDPKSALPNENDNSSLIIIIVSSVAGLILIAGCSFFIFKKIKAKKV